MKKAKFFFMTVIVISLAFVLIGSFRQETVDLAMMNTYVKNVNQYLYFSAEDPFQTQSFELSIYRDNAVPKTAPIYYTLDGNTPTTSSLRYTGPIQIEKQEGFSAVVVKAIIEWKGECSPALTKTYFLGDNIDQLKGTTLISLTSDEDGLYDYDRGILVYGRPYDEFLKTGDVENTPSWRIPANFKLLRGRENERNVCVELFQDGFLFSNQQAGLSVSGGASSYYDQKSLKLIARKAYDSTFSKFAYPIFDSSYSAYSPTSQLNIFDKLILKNGGQERNQSFIRLNIANRFANLCGLVGSVPTKPVIVFLNGDYYSIAQLQPSYSNYYLANTYNVEEESIRIYEYSDWTALGTAGVTNLMKQDLSVTENRYKLEQLVDIDTLLLYYAFEMYANNADWPGNNVKFWRSVGSDNIDNVYADHRLRPLVFDLDAAFRSDKTEAFVRLLDPDSTEEALLPLLLSCEDYRIKFVNFCNDFMSGPFRSDTALSVVESENQAVRDYELNPLLGASVQESLNKSREDNVEEIRSFIINRESSVRSYLAKYLGCSKPYVVKIEAPKEGASIHWGILSLQAGDASFQGTYYKDAPITISADIFPGFEFDGWMVNGKKLTQPVITISADMIQGDNVKIELQVHPADNSRGVQINEIKAKGGSDWVELFNPSQQAVSLKDFYLSDDESNLKKYALPELTLEGNAYLLLNGKNNQALFQYGLNFSLSQGETLFLSDKYGTILERLNIPKMQEHESYGRLNQGNQFVFFRTPTPAAQN